MVNAINADIEKYSKENNIRTDSVKIYNINDITLITCLCVLLYINELNVVKHYAKFYPT